MVFLGNKEICVCFFMLDVENWFWVVRVVNFVYDRSWNNNVYIRLFFWY